MQKSELSTATKFTRNSFFNILGHLVGIPIAIIITPYMIRELGKAQYGLWAIAGVVTSYAQLSDVGITKALVKFVAEDWVERKAAAISGVLSTAFFTYLAVGGLVAGGLLAVRQQIIGGVFRVPQELQADALFVITGIILIFYVNLVFSVYDSALRGLQRMDLVNIISSVSLALRSLGIFLFLYFGHGLRGLIINNAIFSGLTIAANVYFCKKITGAPLSLEEISRQQFRRLFGFSVNVFFSGLIGLFQNPINKIIIARYTSLVNVAFYQLGTQLQGVLRTLFEVGMNPLLPAASELDSANDKESLEKIFLALMRALFLFAFPTFLLFMALAGPIFQVWLGQGYEAAAVSAQFLLLANFFGMLALPQYIILMGLGRPQLVTISHIIAAVLNVSIALILVFPLGLYGVLISETISCIVAAIFIQSVFVKISGISLRKTCRGIPWRGIMLSMLLLGVIIFLIYHMNNWSIIKLMAFFSSFFTSYIILLFWVKVINEADKKVFFFLIRTLKEMIWMKPQSA